MKTINDLNLTELEIKVLSDLIDNLYAEPGFSDHGCTDMARHLKLPINTIKGVVGSLCKKGICYVDDQFKDIVYLSPNHYFLHPEWSIQ